MLNLSRKAHGYLQIPKPQAKISCLLTSIFHLRIPIETLITDSEPKSIFNDLDESPSTKPFENRDPFAVENVEQFDQSRSVNTCTVRISRHPWPEWVGLMEHLCRSGYLEEEVGNPFRCRGLDSKNANLIRTACLNFARDRVDLMRYFSSIDIQVIAGSGCPIIDRKVVNSGKRLRAHVGIDEGHVCGSCSLRGNCNRAYVKAREGEVGRTVDVMRLLLTYGLDPVTGMVENKSCLNKLVVETARRLLKEIVEHSMKELNSESPTATFTKWSASVQESSIYQGQDHSSVSTKQGDWICSKCNLKNSAKNTKCVHNGCRFLERHRKVGEDQDRLALKKGDWICHKCNFLNFGKNTRCLKCDENPPKRLLNHGEWECDSCNYINFRRNAACIKCDHRRSKSVVLGRH
ncbi:zinc finger protein VAR3, chloroplastic-like [Rhododendron vialii]|uniref:zinc finger protein VAR3, chloroplastic-like n=1 Tax=Rhododendron vialii TaxID=182163 RepID=UPI00265DCF35|nr:zinc finger protein VAR3, chloroplastic-like [Rhododendron vialii]